MHPGAGLLRIFQLQQISMLAGYAVAVHNRFTTRSKHRLQIEVLLLLLQAANGAASAVAAPNGIWHLRLACCQALTCLSTCSAHHWGESDRHVVHGLL